MKDKFSVNELTVLRSELMQHGLDSFQAAEMFQLFLMGRGYGVSPTAALDAAARIEGSGCNLEVMQRELEQLAWVQ